MPYYPEKKPEPSGEEQKQTKITEKQIRLLRLSVAVFSCFLILYGSVRLILYTADLSASRDTARELQQMHNQEEPETESVTRPPEPSALPSISPIALPESLIPTETPQPEEDEDALQPLAYPNNPDLKISERFKKLRKKGKYIIGWLSFDQVDEAVVQKDNTYFLTHDAKGKKNSNGAIFLDSGISLKTRPYTIILYGHNMKSGNMLGRLKKYKESAYFYKHRIITFDTMYEDGQYAVFAVMEMSTTPGVARWYDLWSLTTNNYAYREEAIQALERRSVISSALDVQADDQILLLVTCLDGDTERLVVAARRLREDEGETTDHLIIRTK